MNLFELSSVEFTLHSKLRSNWKIECDALTDKDWKCLASLIAVRYKFGHVIGVHTGGDRLAHYLKFYEEEDNPTLLIVDDVLTTGWSMESVKQTYQPAGGTIKGVVVFARGRCPDWVEPLF